MEITLFVMIQSLYSLLRVLILSIKCLPYIYFPSFDVILGVLVFFFLKTFFILKLHEK